MGRRISVLVVDDSASVREFHRNVLEWIGYDVSLAGNYMEADQALSGGRFGGVIFDNDIGSGRTGIDLLRDLRSGVYGAEKARTPVLVVCADAAKVCDPKEKYLDKSWINPEYTDLYEISVKRVFGDPNVDPTVL